MNGLGVALTVLLAIVVGCCAMRARAVRLAPCWAASCPAKCWREATSDERSWGDGEMRDGRMVRVGP